MIKSFITSCPGVLDHPNADTKQTQSALFIPKFDITKNLFEWSDSLPQDETDNSRYSRILYLVQNETYGLWIFV